MTNLCMDYVVLYIVNKVCRFAATKLRILFAATLGAVWSVIEIIMTEKMHWIMLICTYVLISFFMIRICACECRFKEMLKGVFVLYGVTFVLAGAMHMFYYNTYAGYLINQVVMKDVDLLLFVGASLLLLYLILVQLFRIKAYADKICKVRIQICEQYVELRAMVDTGNVLVDPYVGKPVCVVEKTHFNNVLSEINDLQKYRYHIIPFSSLGCERGLLEVITVDNMYIYYRDCEVKVENALIGLAGMRLSSDDEYHMLINAQVLE